MRAFDVSSVSPPLIQQHLDAASTVLLAATCHGDALLCSQLSVWFSTSALYKCRTQQVIYACLAKSVDALQHIHPGDMTCLDEHDLAEHFAKCCKQENLSREASVAKAAASYCRSLCVKICYALYLQFKN
jgi:hypothetical protein